MSTRSTTMNHLICFLFFLFNIFHLQKCDFESLPEITPKCLEQINEFIQEFSTNRPQWTQQMIDSNSRVPKRKSNLKFDDFGNLEQCLGVRNPNGTIFGQYCLGLVYDKENPVDEYSGLLPIWALCLPDGCNLNDSTIVANVVLSSLLEQKNFFVETYDFLCQTLADANPKLTPGAAVAILVLACITMLVVVASFYEYYYTKGTLKYHSTTNGTLVKPCPTVIMAFSLITNCRSTFKIEPPKNDHFPCLNGLRFLSMLWVLIIHQYQTSMLGLLAKTDKLENWPMTLHSKLFLNGSYCVDTFFVISGTLLSYGFMKSRSKNQPFNLVRYYLHRCLRLIGPFAMMVLISSTLFEYMGSGPKWPYIKYFTQQKCQKYWWSALLHIQNYFNPEDMCIFSSWYLMVDMQIYLFSPIVFFLLWKYPKVTQALIGICIIGSSYWSFVTVWNHNLRAFVFVTNTNYVEFIRTISKYYFLTHLRTSSWFIGAILGYFIFNIKQGNAKFVLKKSVLSILWVLSLGTLLLSVFLVQFFYGKEYDPLPHGLSAALIRPIWSLAIAWIILACTNGYGGPINWLLSLPVFQFFNKFIYGIYVVQEIVISVVAFNRKYPDDFSDFQQAYDFWGTFFLCFGLAVLMVLLVECPIAIVEKTISKKLERGFLPENGITTFRNIDQQNETSDGTDGTFRTTGQT